MNVRCVARYCCLAVSLATLGGMGRSPSHALPSVRRLVFHVIYDSRSQFSVPTMGYEDHGGQSGWSSILGPHVHREPTVTVDVVAAPADGSLVGDVSEVDGAWSKPRVRVGVTNGALTYQPGIDVTDLTEEERVLLHFLARDLIGPERVSVGENWHDVVHLDGTNVDTDFRISHVDLAEKTFDASLSGATEKRFGAADVSMTGTMTYDLALLVPIAIHVTSDTARLTPSLDTDVTATIDATLTSDSFDIPSLAPQGEPTGT